VIEHFREHGVAILDGPADARAVLARAREGLGRAVRGTRAIEVLARAAGRWRTEPAWRDGAQACAAAFGVGARADDAAQIDGLADLLDPAAWTRKLELELGSPRLIDREYESTCTEAILAQRPLGVVLHVAPGNGFVGGVDSFLHGIVAGNQNVVKLSRSTPAVAAVLVELLEACGLPPGQVQLVVWDAGSSEAEAALRAGVDAFVVWGGDAAIQHYRANAPAGARAVVHGPKLSFSVLTAQGAGDADALARLVDDVCRWEQASCSSSQLLLTQVPAGLDDFAGWRSALLTRIGAAFVLHGAAHPPRTKRSTSRSRC
jgi:acyl-CoA reductase-like NAD-dependent aldehyde dehydrogenase